MKEQEKNPVIEQMKAVLRQKRMTQVTMARILKCSEVTVSRWLRGKMIPSFAWTSIIIAHPDLQPKIRKNKT